jgi:hypothetical protein
MPQFRPLAVRFLDSSSGNASGLGNNAAWLCPCGHSLPLIASLAIAPEVACPACERGYKLKADGNRAGSVEQIS